MRQLILTFFCGMVRMRGGCLVFCEGVFGWGGFEIGVGRSNFKIGLGVGSGIVGAGGANFEIGTPDPRLLFDWLAKFTSRRAARISIIETACVDHSMRSVFTRLLVPKLQLGNASLRSSASRIGTTPTDSSSHPRTLDFEWGSRLNQT